MDMLRQIKLEYELSDLNWITVEEVFNSDRGKKRIRIWKDKQLLQWHVKWRDEISKQSGILLDRMIRTKEGNPFFISDKGWVSIHDEIEEPFPTKGKEAQWGRLFGTILASGLEQSLDCQRVKKQEPLTLSHVRGSIEQLSLIDPMTKLVLERSYFEAKNRIRKALILKDGIQQKQPILTPLCSIVQAKQVFFNLFWVCGDDQPVRGYEPIRRLLEEWYIENGEESTIKLVESMNSFFPLKEEQGLILLAEFMMPYEFERTIQQLSKCTTTNETSNVIEQYFKNWEVSRKLVLLISKWIEKEREKVVAR
jgi:hypothetical protein